MVQVARPSIAPHLAVEVGEPRERVEGEGDLGGPRQDAPVPRLDQLVQAAAVDELRSICISLNNHHIKFVRK